MLVVEGGAAVAARCWRHSGAVLSATATQAVAIHQLWSPAGDAAEATGKGKSYVRTLLTKAVTKGKITQTKANEVLTRIIIRRCRRVRPGRRGRGCVAAQQPRTSGRVGQHPQFEHRNGADSSSLALVLGKARVAPRLLGVDAV